MSTQIKGGCRKIFFIAAIVVVGFLAYRTYQLVNHMKENPRVDAPGEAAFRAAEKSIVRNDGAGAYGNTKEAKVLAGKFSRQMGILREEFFTAGEKGDFSLTDGVFLTHCNLVKDHCIFLVHVPQLRHFTDDAKKSMAELAWMSANHILAEAGYPNTTKLAVGVKGVINFGAIYSGIPDGDGEHLSGIQSKAKGLSDKRRLFRYFHEPPIEQPGQESSPPTSTVEPPSEGEAKTPAAATAAPAPVAVPE